MNSERTPGTTASAYASRGGSTGPRIAWPTLLIRMFIIVLPAQLLGFFLGGAIISATGVLADRPEFSFLINVVAGILSGLAVGLVLTPGSRQLLPYLATSAAFGLVIVLILVALGQLKLGDRADPELSRLALGALLTAGPQTLVAWGLWNFKRSS